MSEDTKFIKQQQKMEKKSKRKGRHITLGDIDDFEEFNEEVSTFEKENEDPIYLDICSEGGDYHVGMAMAGRILASNCEFIATIYGHACSAAVFPLIVSKDRRMSKLAWVMVHNAKGGETGSIRDIDKYIKQFKNEELRYIKFLAEYTKKDEKYWKKVITSGLDRYYDPEECKKMGVIDEII